MGKLKEANFDAKIRRVQSDLKEPKDGSERVITTITLIAEELPEEVRTQLAKMQKSGEMRVTVGSLQGSLVE